MSIFYGISCKSFAGVENLMNSIIQQIRIYETFHRLLLSIQSDRQYTMIINFGLQKGIQYRATI